MEAASSRREGVGEPLMGQRIGVIWARVSEDKGQDVEGQVRELKALADRMGIVVPEENVYRVTSSAFRSDPEDKAKVMEAARRRKFDVLFIWALDRWSRRRIDGTREVFETLPAYGVRVVSLQESFLSTEGMNDGLRAVIGNLFLWIAEEESRRKSERVKLRYRTNRNRAAGGGGNARWGRGKVPNADEVAAVKAAALEGLSVRAIAGRTGVPKSTVSRLLSQTRSEEGGSVSSGVPNSA